jgi:hypothetical protein
VQVRAAEGGYEVLFGAELKAYPATKSGEKLVVTHPELGVVELTVAPEDQLQLAEEGRTTVLERVPQHQ